MTNDDPVRDFLSKGGKVTVCQPGSAWMGKKQIAPSLTLPKRPARNPWWVRSDWKLVKVAEDQIAPAERWLREREVRFYTNLTKVGSNWHVRIEDANIAVMFKLTWGGS